VSQSVDRAYGSFLREIIWIPYSATSTAWQVMDNSNILVTGSVTTTGGNSTYSSSKILSYQTYLGTHPTQWQVMQCDNGGAATTPGLADEWLWNRMLFDDAAVAGYFPFKHNFSHSDCFSGDKNFDPFAANKIGGLSMGPNPISYAVFATVQSAWNSGNANALNHLLLFDFVRTLGDIAAGVLQFK